MDTSFVNTAVLMPDLRVQPASVHVRDGRIAAVVPDADDAAPRQRDTAETGVERVDLDGAFMLPGFVDAHFHLMALALKQLRCDLSAATSADDVVARLAAWASENPGDDPVVGVEFDESAWTDGRLPTRAELDRIDDRRPIYARRVCCHVGVANSALLARIESPGRFIDAERGRITEEAVFDANRRTTPAREDVEVGIEAAIRKLHRLGVTAIHDVVDPQNFDAYVAGLRRARSPLHVHALFCVPPDDFGRMRDQAGDLESFVPMGVKLFADGSLGARTAALSVPYRDADTRGDYLLDGDDLARTLRECVEDDITCAVHAIGDRAVANVVREMSRFPSDTRLFRVEHAEMIDDETLDALSAASVRLGMQPNFVRNWGGVGGLYERRLGAVRGRACNPFRALADRDVDVLFSSDTMPPGPMYGIKGATEHPNPGERLSIAEAIDRYTRVPNACAHPPRSAGTIAAGQSADFAVLGSHPLETDPDAQAVRRTVVAGRTVFNASNSST